MGPNTLLGDGEGSAESTRFDQNKVPNVDQSGVSVTCRMVAFLLPACHYAATQWPQNVSRRPQTDVNFWEESSGHHNILINLFKPFFIRRFKIYNLVLGEFPQLFSVGGEVAVWLF